MTGKVIYNGVRLKALTIFIITNTPTHTQLGTILTIAINHGI